MIATAPASAKPIVRSSVTFTGPDAEGVGRIVIDRPDDRVNAIDVRLVSDLAAAVAQARAAAPKVVIVTSGKPDQFVGGADLTMLRSAPAEGIADASRALQRVLADLAALPCPVVAAIGGSALGGGNEIALACDWRVAASSPAVRIGQPEVQLGLIPAAGGTQRLPRLVGLPRALDVILNSRRLTARRALRAGLVDEVVHPAKLDRAAADCGLRGGKRRLRGGATTVERAITWIPPLRAFALSRARFRVLKETKGRYPAPLRALDAIAAGLGRGMASGYAAEATSFGELAASETARNLVALLLLTLRQRGAGAELGSPRMVHELGVVGAGFMGSGIAQAGAAAGLRVRVRDVDAAAVARGLSAARKLTEDAARKGVFDRREAVRIVGRLSGAPDLSGFGRCELVVEAVFEELAIKRRVIAELEAAMGDDAIIASNTSALPIGEIAAQARVPERIVGMHFFSPVHRMPLVEVVWPARADGTAVATAVAVAHALGKTPIVVRDGPGFYTTRVISALSGEALQVLQGGARIEDVDAALVRFGWPIGPLALADEVGLEVAAHAGETVARARGLERPRIVGLLIAEGLKGKRSGGGFYRYARRGEGHGRLRTWLSRGSAEERSDYDGKRRVGNARVYELLGTTPSAPTEDIAERCTLAFVNEAARCLDEGILRSPGEGDLGAVLGLGFPPFLGGPFRWADARGPALRDALRRLEEKHGPRFAAAESLRDGRRFYGA